MEPNIKQQQELATKVRELLTDCGWTAEVMRWFIQELVLVGIDTAEQFELRFVFETKDYRPHKDFVMYLVWEVFGWADDLAELKGLVIDWEASWEQHYRNDYCCFYFDRAHYYFNKK